MQMLSVVIKGQGKQVTLIPRAVGPTIGAFRTPALNPFRSMVQFDSLNLVSSGHCDSSQAPSPWYLQSEPISREPTETYRNHLRWYLGSLHFVGSAQAMSCSKVGEEPVPGRWIPDLFVTFCDMEITSVTPSSLEDHSYPKQEGFELPLPCDQIKTLIHSFP